MLLVSRGSPSHGSSTADGVSGNVRSFEAGAVWFLDQNGSVWREASGLATKMHDASAGAAGSILGHGPDDVWISSSNGFASHWNGTTWTDARTVDPLFTTGVALSPGGDLWFAAPGLFGGAMQHTAR